MVFRNLRTVPIKIEVLIKRSPSFLPPLYFNVAMLIFSKPELKEKLRTQHCGRGRGGGGGGGGMRAIHVRP